MADANRLDVQIRTVPPVNRWRGPLALSISLHILARRGGNMARITVEDCVDKVENRFELVLLAAHRARTIAKGSWSGGDKGPAR